jgi:exo-beta-1,3-glucanase (GH17 family)
MFLGINYGSFHHVAEMPRTLISDAQFASDVGTISRNFTYIKTYGDDAGSGLDRVAPIAASQFPKLRIYQGVFENCRYNSSADTTFLDTAISLANSYPTTVVTVVVGNECLDTDSNRDPVSVTQLAADLQYVRSRIKNPGAVKITTGLGYQASVSNGAQLVPYVDSIMVNIDPFDAPVTIDGAISILVKTYNMLNNRFEGKQVIIGETGWPSAGDDNGVAIPSVANEQTYIQAVLANSNQIGATFLFEAFDEPWLRAQDSRGPHWGVWDSMANPKFPLTVSKRAGGKIAPLSKH